MYVAFEPGGESGHPAFGSFRMEPSVSRMLFLFGPVLPFTILTPPRCYDYLDSVTGDPDFSNNSALPLLYRWSFMIVETFSLFYSKYFDDSTLYLGTDAEILVTELLFLL